MRKEKPMTKQTNTTQDVSEWKKLESLIGEIFDFDALSGEEQEEWAHNANVKIATELDAVRKEVNDEWMNQKANDHDARIRADERRKVLEMIQRNINAPHTDEVEPDGYWVGYYHALKNQCKQIEQMGEV